jgi:UDP-2-acetamido-3-amino-2,3-dideoxy-glucuronate N-acetyltransferase
VIGTAGIDPSAEIDPSADVDPDVAVGARTSIASRARLAAGARIGAECTIGRDVLLDSGVVLGDRVIIGDGTLVYRGAIFEDGVFVGPRAIITNERHPRAITSTGDLVSDEGPTEPTTIRRGASLGAGSVTVAGVEIGEFAMVAAGAVVTTSVGGHALVAGNPARRLGWVCSCGEPLVDAEGAPAAAEPAHYARHPELRCPSCNRVFVYVPDADGLVERVPAKDRLA